MPPRTVRNPPNPWQSAHVELLEPAPDAKLQVHEETAKSILSENRSPDLPFRWSLNPYRGCHHGCAYCYARPSHQYLGYGAGTDFDRNIVVKTNAPELLHKRLSSSRWRGEAIIFSGNTDCYQPLEASYKLTRQCLEVCNSFCNPVSLITKGALIQRDVDLLVELNERARLSVYVSIAFADKSMARQIEPWAATPQRRLETIRVLAAAGITVGVSVSPVIPGLNDAQMPQVMQQATDAGASRAFMTLLRLAPEVEQVFFARLDESYPDRADKVRHALQAMRGDKGLTGGGFGERMAGQGARWRAIEDLYQLQAKRCGFAASREMEWVENDAPTTYRRPGTQMQLEL